MVYKFIFLTISSPLSLLQSTFGFWTGLKFFNDFFAIFTLKHYIVSFSQFFLMPNELIFQLELCDFFFLSNRCCNLNLLTEWTNAFELPTYDEWCRWLILYNTKWPISQKNNKYRVPPALPNGFKSEEHFLLIGHQWLCHVLAVTRLALRLLFINLRTHVSHTIECSQETHVVWTKRDSEREKTLQHYITQINSLCLPISMYSHVTLQISYCIWTLQGDTMDWKNFLGWDSWVNLNLD